MAIALPYPGMDFVPLDILTAGELNQMVANTEFLANQFPVQNANIDWNSLEVTIPLADFLTMRTGFTLASGCYVKKIGKYIIAHLIVKRTSGYYSSTQETVADIKPGFLPEANINTAGFGCTTEWTVTTVAHVFMNNGGLFSLRIQSGATNCNFIMADLIYQVA